MSLVWRGWRHSQLRVIAEEEPVDGVDVGEEPRVRLSLVKPVGTDGRAAQSVPPGDIPFIPGEVT